METQFSLAQELRRHRALTVRDLDQGPGHVTPEDHNALFVNGESLFIPTGVPQGTMFFVEGTNSITSEDGFLGNTGPTIQVEDDKQYCVFVMPEGIRVTQVDKAGDAYLKPEPPEPQKPVNLSTIKAGIYNTVNSQSATPRAYALFGLRHNPAQSLVTRFYLEIEESIGEDRNFCEVSVHVRPDNRVIVRVEKGRLLYTKFLEAVTSEDIAVKNPDSYPMPSDEEFINRYVFAEIQTGAEVRVDVLGQNITSDRVLEANGNMFVNRDLLTPEPVIRLYRKTHYRESGVITSTNNATKNLIIRTTIDEDSGHLFNLNLINLATHEILQAVISRNPQGQYTVGWMDSTIPYPTVEVLEEDSGELVFTGSVGQKLIHLNIVLKGLIGSFNYFTNYCCSTGGVVPKLLTASDRPIVVDYKDISKGLRKVESITLDANETKEYTGVFVDQTQVSVKAREAGGSGRWVINQALVSIEHDDTKVYIKNESSTRLDCVVVIDY